MRSIIILFIIISFTSCKSTKETQFFYYHQEEGKAYFYNARSKHKPLLVIIPSIYNSLFTDEYISTLSKKNRLVVIHFLSSTNTTRLQHIDGIENRLNYYNTVLSSLETQHTISTLIAEGMNANLAIQLGFNFNKPDLILINSWHPTLRERLTTNCYIKQDNSCDSLLHYLSFSERVQVDSLLTSLSTMSSTDNIYGNHTLGKWRQFMNYTSEDILTMYPSNPKWIYTTNSGLLSKNEYTTLKNSRSKRNNVYLLSKKEFLKKQSLFSN